MSTKTKATPGPWKVEGSSTAHIVSRHTPKGRKVASLLVSTHEDSANAHLIAAAPEMLEAICTIYGLANLQSLLETKYSKALCNDIMRMMQETIAKAKGEA